MLGSTGMTEDLLGYNEMVETAMRSVVRQALEKASNDGLPGEHHFYITFRTHHPDVALPEHLKTRYPEEMTIVLQHQFWDLESDAEGFSVALSFNHKREILRIPYDALITFADPSVNFGLQFHVDPEDETLGADQLGVPVSDEQDPEPATGDKGMENAGEAAEPGEEGEGGDNVVALDAFRKKQ